jgi:serine/threonine protein kinase
VNKKALPADDEQDLLEEVRILRALKHPNIIDIYQFYKQEKTHYYVVMEYMKGGEVRVHQLQPPEHHSN